MISGQSVTDSHTHPNTYLYANDDETATVSAFTSTWHSLFKYLSINSNCDQLRINTHVSVFRYTSVTVQAGILESSNFKCVEFFFFCIHSSWNKNLSTDKMEKFFRNVSRCEWPVWPMKRNIWIWWWPPRQWFYYFNAFPWIRWSLNAVREHWHEHRFIPFIRLLNAAASSSHRNL